MAQLVNIDMMYKIGRLGTGPKPVDWAKAFDPVIKEQKKKTKERKDRVQKLINKMPSSINISKLPEELRPGVTQFLSESSKEYIDASNATEFVDPQSQEYAALIQKTNQISGSHESLSSQLELLAQKISDSVTKRDISPYANKSENYEHELFATKDIYSQIKIRGGKIYYPDMLGNEKSIDDFAIATQSDVTLATNVETLHEDYRERAEEGLKWDEKGALRRLDLILKEAGSKKVGDLMYTYYIDEYIEENYGMNPNCVGDDCDFEAGFSGLTKEIDPEAYEVVFDQLQEEDLVDEFRSHFLGMLGETHTEHFKEKVTGINSGGTGKSGKIGFGSGVWLTPGQVKEEVNAIKERANGLAIMKHDKTGQYFVENGKWYYRDSNVDKKPVTENDVLRGMKYYKYTSKNKKSDTIPDTPDTPEWLQGYEGQLPQLDPLNPNKQGDTPEAATESISPKDLWKTFQGEFYYSDSYPIQIKTKEDLIRLANDIDKGKADLGYSTKYDTSYPDGAEGFIEMINEQNKTNIDAKNLSKMIRDLIKNKELEIK